MFNYKKLGLLTTMLMVTTFIYLIFPLDVKAVTIPPVPNEMTVPIFNMSSWVRKPILGRYTISHLLAAGYQDRNFVYNSINLYGNYSRPDGYPQTNYNPIYNVDYNTFSRNGAIDRNGTTIIGCIYPANTTEPNTTSLFRMHSFGNYIIAFGQAEVDRFSLLGYLSPVELGKVKNYATMKAKYSIHRLYNPVYKDHMITVDKIGTSYNNAFTTRAYKLGWNSKYNSYFKGWVGTPNNNCGDANGIDPRPVPYP